MINTTINNDYIDDFVHGYVVRQKLDDRLREAEQHRMLKEYLAAHPEQRPAARIATLLRRVADRLAPEPAVAPRLRPLSGGN